jgi:hypothetical protein
MQLSSNNSLSSHADTAVHHFNNIARTLAGCQSPEDRSTLLTFAQAGMPGDVSTLLYKHKDVVELLASVHGIDVFAVNGLTPGQMLESKKTSWGVSRTLCLHWICLTHVSSWSPSSGAVTIN